MLKAMKSVFLCIFPNENYLNSLRTENEKNLFIKISNRYGALRCFIFSVVSSSGDITSIHVKTILYVNC